MTNIPPVRLSQRGLTLPADVQTPISLYLGLVGERPGILLESAEVDGRLGRYSFILWDFRLMLSCRDGKLEVLASDPRLAPLVSLHGMDFVEGLKAANKALTIVPPDDMDNLPAATRALTGYFGWGLAGLFEPKLAPVMPASEAEACLVLPARVVLYDHLHHRCVYLCLDDDGSCEPPSLNQSRILRQPRMPIVGLEKAVPGAEGFKTAVEQARELIRQGECIQVVPSCRFEADFEGDPFVLYRRLRQVNPSPYMFYMKLPEVTLAGSSPELLVRCEDGLLETRPIAGTRPRGATEQEDAALAKDLLDDPKERAEHVMLVDLGRNDLGRIAEPGTVTVERFMQVERFSHVSHLTSYVEAKLRQGLDGVDVLASTFPAGTLSGAPKVRAMEIISELETVPRGPYGGAVGWLGLDDGRVDLDTGITIRSLWIRNGKVQWQAGAGIVFDSVPETEWQEVLNKSRVVRLVLESGSGKEHTDVFTY